MKTDIILLYFIYVAIRILRGKTTSTPVAALVCFYIIFGNLFLAPEPNPWILIPTLWMAAILAYYWIK